MKDRVREALFNLLGPAVAGKHAIDLFAGTGALGLEALSRGASRATFFEQHFPTAGLIRQNIAALDLEEIAEVVAADTFIWFRRPAQVHQLAEPGVPWVVFCSPPFEFYQSRRDDMLALMQTLMSAAPPESMFALESDERFNFVPLPDASRWDVRDYPPARVGIYRGPP